MLMRGSLPRSPARGCAEATSPGASSKLPKLSWRLSVRDSRLSASSICLPRDWSQSLSMISCRSELDREDADLFRNGFRVLKLCWRKVAASLLDLFLTGPKPPCVRLRPLEAGFFKASFICVGGPVFVWRAAAPVRSPPLPGESPRLFRTLLEELAERPSVGAAALWCWAERWLPACSSSWMVSGVCAKFSLDAPWQEDYSTGYLGVSVLALIFRPKLFPTVPKSIMLFLLFMLLPPNITFFLPPFLFFFLSVASGRVPYKNMPTLLNNFLDLYSLC